MANDTQILKEIVFNEREITHPEYGTFIVKRPTFRVLAEIDNARSRQINRDLQTRETIENTDGSVTSVPAFLSRAAKAEQLKFHSIWTDETEEKIAKATEEYKDACVELDKAGFQGPRELKKDLIELRKMMDKAIEKPTPELTEALDIVVPNFADVERGGVDSTPEAIKAYQKARAVLQKKVKSALMDELLVNADRLHKLCGLVRKGFITQLSLITLKMSEYGLFADTLEARADKAAQVAKIFYCTLDPVNKRPYFDKLSSMDDQNPDMVSWIHGQIERLERLEPGDDPNEENDYDRFNFLAPIPASALLSGELLEEETVNPDGEQSEKT